jgi:hypothetical protein
VNLPFLIWNAINSWPSLEQTSNDFAGTYWSRLRGFFVGLLPRDLGVRRISDGDWAFGRPAAAVVTIGVLAAASFGAYRQCRRRPWHGALLAAPLVAMWPLMALLLNLGFVLDGRYGIIVFPVLVLCLASAVEPLLRAAPRPTGTVLVFVWVLLLAVPFLKHETGTTTFNQNASIEQLIATLDAEGYNRVAGHYNAVLPIELMSDGRIRVAIAGNPYFPRFPVTQRMVDATPPDRLAYVFAPGPIGDTWVKLPVDDYRQVEVAGWVLYFPT